MWWWLKITFYVCLAGSIAVVIIFGALIAVDRNRRGGHVIGGDVGRVFVE